VDSAIIQMEDVHKWYGHLHVLRGINLSVQPGEVVVLIGPSGSGKSTLLRCLNGLEPIQKGNIVVDGIQLKGQKNLVALRREVGFVFQIFQPLSAHDNIGECCPCANEGAWS